MEKTKHETNVVIGIASVVGTTIVVAHHGLASDYDRDKVMTIKGRLMEIDWRNPHPFCIDVEGPNGEAMKWKFGTC